MEKFVVARFTNSGFGDHVSCVLGAWHYAHFTGRTLVVDWRGSRFNPTPGRNCFFDFFRETASIAGVPVIADDRLDWIAQTDQLYPAKWDPENLRGTGHVPHDADEVDEMNALMMSGEDRPETTIVVNQYLNALPAKVSFRTPLKDLVYHDRIASEARRFLDRTVGDTPLVGIHLRNGNGENIGYRSAHWLDPAMYLRQRLRDSGNSIHQQGEDGQARGRFRDNAGDSLTANPKRSRTEALVYRKAGSEALRLAEANGIENYAVLLFTDAPRVIDGMTEILPDVLTYPKKLFGKGEGPLHQLQAGTVEGQVETVDPEVLDNMLVEQALLRQCEALVCIPSNFSEIRREELPEGRVSLLSPPLLNRLIGKLVR